MIVHADTAYAKGRRLAEKLKENIPRQMFEIPIQAAIGGKIKMCIRDSHKAGLPTGAQFISDEKRYHADAETQVPLNLSLIHI